jgi:hypothetical protein
MRLIPLLALAVLPSLPYEAKLENDDGSITFLNPTLQGHVISGLSRTEPDRLTICKAMGLPGESVVGVHANAQAFKPFGDQVPALSLSYGRQNGFESDSNSWIDRITCRSELTPKKISTRATRITLNDDQTVTITQPRFRSPGNRECTLASSNARSASTLDGVCRLYGFKQAVREGTRESLRIAGCKAVIDSEGRLADVITDLGVAVLETLTCQN